jgi:ribonuclease VapC
MTHVLDASALLAFLHDEPGAEQVRQALDGALISTVNWAEVIQKSLGRRAEVAGMRDEFVEVGLMFEPFTAAQAEAAAHLREKTRQRGLSLADRACLALAIDNEAVVLTADRAWRELDLDLEIQTLR